MSKNSTSAPLRIALAGLGTVGAGVIRLVEANAALIRRRAGRDIVITAVSARDRTKDRGVDISGYGWEDDMTAMAAREDVDVVVELVGGSDGPALALARNTIAGGKALATATGRCGSPNTLPGIRTSRCVRTNSRASPSTPTR